jgi:hypothetical protein
MIAASEATTRTAKMEIRTIPTRVPGMKAPVFAQVVVAKLSYREECGPGAC